MASKKIVVHNDTLETLKKLKVIYGKVTYDELINDLIKISESNNSLDKISNSELQFTVKSLHKKELNRIEALHSRIGYFEKDYFLKIGEIYDYLLSQNNNLNYKNVVPKNDKVEINNSSRDVNNNEINSYRNKIELLEKSHNELEISNEKLNQILGFFKSRIQKKSGVFASGYELSLTEDEFQKLFT